MKVFQNKKHKQQILNFLVTNNTSLTYHDLENNFFLHVRSYIPTAQIFINLRISHPLPWTFYHSHLFTLTHNHCIRFLNFSTCRALTYPSWTFFLTIACIPRFRTFQFYSLIVHEWSLSWLVLKLPIYHILPFGNNLVFSNS